MNQPPYPCKVCGNPQVTFLFSVMGKDVTRGAVFSIGRCESCGIVNSYVLEAAPSQNDLYYQDYHGDPLNNNPLIAILYRIFLRGRRSRVVSLKTTHSLLDYGSGDGSFLRIIKSLGWSIAGIEPNGERNGELNIVKADRELPVEQKYGLITLWHVFEHLQDPLSALAELRNRLLPNGVLYLALPNFDSWEARFGGRNWFHLDIPRHVFHYTPSSVSTLLVRAGFSVEYIRFFSFYYNTFGMLETMLNRIGLSDNFLYNLLKHKKTPFREMSAGTWFVNISLHIILCPFLLIVAAVASFAASCVKKSGTMEVVCRIKP